MIQTYFIQVKNKNIIQKNEFELIKISEWLKTNQLPVNIDKINLIIFHPRRDNENLSLKLPLHSLHGFEIKQVSSAKVIGDQINQNITWKQEITLM